MAFATGAATTLPALFVALEAFATVNGWTVDESDTVSGWPRLHKNSCFVGFRYDGTSPAVTGGRSMGVYQAFGFTGGVVRPGGDPDDSGNGHNDQSGTVSDSNLDNSRCVKGIGDGPFNYWFFEHDDGTIFYVHVVLEVRPSEYRHFGFGKITKFGDWGPGASGGEYCYGLQNIGGPASNSANYFFEGGNSTGNAESIGGSATIRTVGLPGGQASNWAAFYQSDSGSAHTLNRDRAGNLRNRLIGTARGGPIWQAQGWFKGYPGFTGIIPLTVPSVLYVDVTNDRSYMLGEMSDVRLCNIAQFDPQEERVIGGDTWIFFPFTKRGSIGGTTTVSDSYFYGVAYRKEVV